MVISGDRNLIRLFILALQLASKGLRDNYVLELNIEIIYFAMKWSDNS